MVDDRATLRDQQEQQTHNKNQWAHIIHNDTKEDLVLVGNKLNFNSITISNYNIMQKLTDGSATYTSLLCNNSWNSSQQIILSKTYQ